jgi:DNA-binding response OmpR family regulator
VVNRNEAKVGVEAWDGYVFDPRDRSVVVNGVSVTTTEAEFRLALLLFRNLSKLLTREYILRTIWRREPDEPGRSLDTHISQLRRRLNLKPESGFRVSAVYRAGYRLERLSTWDQTSPRGVDRR